MDGRRGKKGGLSLPANLISKFESDDFNNSDWQKSHNIGGKRKSRKESRKDLRQSKRIKRMPAKLRQQHFQDDDMEQPGNSEKPRKSAAPKPPQIPVKAKPATDSKKAASKESVKPFVSAHELEMRRKEEEDAKYYAKKLGLKGLKLKNDDDGMGDILGDLDFDDFQNSQDEEESNSESESNLESHSESDSSDDNRTAAHDTMAKLAALKANKNNGSGTKKSDSSKELRIVNEDDIGASDDSLSEDDEKDLGSEAESSNNEMTAEETMAKLAALKANKSWNSNKKPQPNKSQSIAEDDSLSDSDFESDDSDDDGNDEEMTAEETMARLAALKGKKSSAKKPAKRDDSLSEDDLDSGEESEGPEMTAEETMQKLKALKEQKLNGLNKGSSGSEPELESESESESEDDENPYLPPSRRNQGNVGEEAVSVKKADMAESEATIKMRRIFKGALNRLTETTFNHVVNEIELTFSKNSRAEASEVLTEQILSNISGSQSLQHSFFVVYAGLIAVLYRSMGTSFAAFFVQCLVQEISKQSESTVNYLTLLVECYCLHVVSSRLIYDIVKDCLQHITDTKSEDYVEQVLVIVRNGGSLLRTDDPLALKEVILLLQQRITALGGTDSLPARMRFLVDTIVALKNNRQKATSELVVALRQRMRKSFQSNSANGTKEPLQVGLEDILNSNSKGKWWLVGASWKGSQANTESYANSEPAMLQDEDEGLSGAAPDWLELAKKQRLNTDVRRAVFVALMGAEDYLDACLRIDKLGLKNKQERDIPHVILHCLAQEPVYNPYYALVAGKQCTRHSTRKTFQFRLFDWLDSESQGNTQIAMHYGRFYASLILQKVLGLDILKALDFLGASGDAQVFLEIFFVTLYRDLGRQAEKDARRHFQQGLARVDGQAERDGRELTLLLSKCKEEKVLRGIQLVSHLVTNSEAIRNERDRERILWCTELASDMVDELIKRGGISDDL